MGWFMHHAIVVTAYSAEDADRVYQKAREIFPEVTNMVQAEYEGWWSFLIPPDGSKEGWEESNRGNVRRRQFHEWVLEQSDVSEENPYHIVEIAYGEVPIPIITAVNGKQIATAYPD